MSIHWGAYSGNTEIIKLLLSRGADIEAVNELGMSKLLSYVDSSCFFLLLFCCFDFYHCQKLKFNVNVLNNTRP